MKLDDLRERYRQGRSDTLGDIPILQRYYGTTPPACPGFLATPVNIDRKVPTEAFDTYIGRAGQGFDGYFGNPYKLEEYQRQKGVELFKAYFECRVREDATYRARVLALRGHRLGCFCKPLPCHGDIIAAFVNDFFQERKVLVTGDRRWTDAEGIAKVIKENAPTILVEGEAQGADGLARDAAEALGILVLKFPAPWERLGPEAGPWRNGQMLRENPDIELALAFHDDLKSSRGTKDMVEKLRARNITTWHHFHHFGRHESLGKVLLHQHRERPAGRRDWDRDAPRGAR